jgi:uncharacterized protein
MIPALARFVDALRALRHPVSPAEVIDASRALDLVGLTRRADVKAALRATLAKDRESVAAFDALFDRFFAAPRFPAHGEGAGRIASAGERPRQNDAEPSSPSRSKPNPRAVPSLKPSTKPSTKPRPESPELHEILDRAKHFGDRRAGRLRRVRLRTGAADAADPAKHDLSRRMTTDEERLLAKEVPRLVHTLKLRLARRHAAARRGRPWLRRALRDNLLHGGVPFTIPHRAPKRKSTRVVLLVDVSYSVARASGLFLLMASAFLTFSKRTRVLAFVDRPVDATAAVSRWARGGARPAPAARPPRGRARRGARPGDGIVSSGVSFAELMEGLHELNLEAASDYGRAFHALRGLKVRPRGRDTVLVILGDGRTNRFDPLTFALDELARGCKAVIWLASEPKSRWGTADSALPAYLPSVDLLVEATDLTGLSRGLAEIVRSL